MPPALKVKLPMVFTPVVGEAAIVAPVILQYSPILPGQLSEKEGAPIVNCLVQPEVVSISDAGQLLTIGLIVSNTVTVKVQLSLFPEASVTK